jgi:multidrug resistance efflux pump
VFSGLQTELPHGRYEERQSECCCSTCTTNTDYTSQRPKDRLRIGSLWLVLFAAAIYTVRDGVFQFHTYRLVDGNRASVRTSAAGVIQKVYVAEAYLTRTGDLLLTIKNIEREHRLERTRDGIRLAKAQLDTDIVKVASHCSPPRMGRT